MRTLTLILLSSLVTGLTWDRECQTGPGVQLRLDSKEGGHCAELDLDHDGDCDQSDFGIWQRSEGHAIVVFVVDLSVASMSDPVEFVRTELNKRAAR